MAQLQRQEHMRWSFVMDVLFVALVAFSLLRA